MVSKLFSDILKKGKESGHIPGKTTDSRNWFRQKAKELGKTNETTVIRSDESKLTNRLALGRMYFFMYDPKHKSTLPYYDTFPLIFPVDRTSDGFYGLNLHYLPLKLRATLMDSLYDVTNNSRYDSTTKLKLSYSILKGAERFKLFKPTFKRYLNKHVRSRFLEVYANEWDMALWLQTEQFVGASKTKVWSDSKAIIGV
jgi:hypothetical protein